MSEISLILVLQNKNKQNSEWHGKTTNKIWETHSFWGIFFDYGAIWCSFSSNHRFHLGIDALCLVINIARFYALWCAYIFVVAHVLRMLQLTRWNICLFIQLKSTVLSLSWILSLLRNGKENRIVLFPTKPYRLRIWGKISFATKVRFIFGLCKDMHLFFLFFPHTFPRSPLVSSLISEK